MAPTALQTRAAHIAWKTLAWSPCLLPSPPVFSSQRTQCYLLKYKFLKHPSYNLLPSQKHIHSEKQKLIFLTITCMIRSLPHSVLLTQFCPNIILPFLHTEGLLPPRVLLLIVPPGRISPHISTGPLGHSIQMSLSQRLTLSILCVMAPVLGDGL